MKKDDYSFHPSSFFLHPFDTVWEPRTGQVGEPAFTAIRTADVRLCSYAFGFLTLTLALWLRVKLSAVGFFRVLSIGSTAFALGVLWLPVPCKVLAWAPLITALAVGLLAYGLLLIRGVPRTRSPALHRRKSMLPAPAVWRLWDLSCCSAFSGQTLKAVRFRFANRQPTHPARRRPTRC